MSDVSATSASSAAAPLLVNGIVSGINTTQVIQALLQAYQAPITNLQQEQTTLASQAANYRTINTDMTAVQTAAQALNQSSSWNLMTATSSNTTVATANASAGATAGTLSFTVADLAQGNVLLSSGGVASQAQSVTGATSLLVATGGAAIGFSGLAASAGLTLGSHAISVTQSSAAASVSSAAALSPTTTITAGTNDSLNLDVGGTTYALTLAPGPYSPSALVGAINSAATSAGAPVMASLSSGGELQLATTEQGSAATLSVTGSSLSALGLTSGQSAVGVDAVVAVDGTDTTLSAINPGSTVSLNAPSGSITATVASSPASSGSLISAGDASSALVGTGNQSLGAVVSNLNSAGLNLTATAVQESSGQYRLQIAAGATGLAGAVSIDSSGLSGGALGPISTITNAVNAAVNVGGAGGYTLESATNTFSNLLAGSSVTVASLGTTTLTVTPDASGEASAVSSLVTAANQALSDISSLAGYNASTKTAGPLMGSAVVQSLQQSILSTFATAAGASGLGSAANVGIKLTSTGTITFDQSAFEKAFQSNPSSVTSLFTAGGTLSPASPSYGGQVSLIYGDPKTAAGSYSVQLTQSATQATATGSVLAGGTVSAGESLDIKMNGVDANFAVSAGQSLSEVATGLNQLFAAQGFGLSAYVQNGDQLTVASDAYGSANGFSIASSAPGAGTTGLGGAVADAPVDYAGTDVAGSINGVAATGNGQELIAPSSDPALHGLSLLVTTPGISSATTIGSYTYAPGLAQQLLSIAQGASDASTGSLSAAIKGLGNQSSGLTGQITNYQNLEQEQQTLLTNQFATMESTLGSLKNESSALSSQINNLAGF